jgi:hypothetical protein
MRAYFQRLGSGTDYIDHVGDDDRAPIVAMTSRLQGIEQARLAEFWLVRQPDTFRVFRSAGGRVRGYAALLRLHEASPDDLAIDPGSRALWDYAQRHDPPRAGEGVGAWRFFLDAELHHGPSPSLNLIAQWYVEEMMTRDRCAWDFVATYTDAAVWEPVMCYIEFTRAPEADYEIGGTRYVTFAHDWRRIGVSEWLERTTNHELGTPAVASPAAAPVVLSQPEFRDAVRNALRDLHAPDRLSGNPLLRSRLVRQRAASADPRQLRAALVALMTEAVRELRDNPRTNDLYEVLNRTFLHPHGTQERVAEGLHLSFSTYRRHRDRAVAQVTDRLWEGEVYHAPEFG